jgi:hypothetical protein
LGILTDKVVAVPAGVALSPHLRKWPSSLTQQAVSGDLIETSSARLICGPKGFMSLLPNR